MIDQIKNPFKTPDKDEIINRILDRQSKLLSNKSNNVGNFISSFVFGTLIILIIAIINSNIIFMMKYASVVVCKGRSLLDIYFPSDCNSVPYGTPVKAPCKSPKPHNFFKGYGEVDNLCYSGGGSTKSFGQFKGGGQNKWFRSNQLFKYLYENSLSKPTKSSIIYDDFDTGSPIKEWYIRSLSSTSTGVHRYIKEILQLGKDLPNPLLMLVGATIMLSILGSFSGIYTFIAFTWNMIYNSSILNNIFPGGDILLPSWLPFLIMIPLCFIPLGLSFIDAIWNQISVTLKLMFFPLVTGGWSGILKIIKENNITLAYVIALSMVLSAKQHLNKTYSDSMSYAYLFFIIFHIGKVIYEYNS